MSTTVMKDSKVGDAWIQEACRVNPVRRVIDPKTDQPNGNILTGPVRLAFCDSLFDAKKPQGRENDPSAKGKWGTMAVYPPYTDFTIMYEDWYKVMGAVFPEYYQGDRYHGLDNPFHDQGSKAVKYGGFTPGLYYINHTTNFQPQIVDASGNIIVDRNKVYAGCWAILAVNVYSYGKTPPQPRKGVGFGLQQVMIIADDVKLSGGAPDPRVTFAGVNIKPPVIAPASQFGAQVVPFLGQPQMPYPTGAPPAPPLGAMPPPVPTAVMPPADDDVSALF